MRYPLIGVFFKITAITNTGDRMMIGLMLQSLLSTVALSNIPHMQIIGLMFCYPVTLNGIITLPDLKHRLGAEFPTTAGQ